MTSIETPAVYTLRVPQTTTLNPTTAHALLSQLLTRFNDRPVLQIIAQDGQVQWRVIDYWTEPFAPDISQYVQSAYPDADIEVSPNLLPEFTAETPRYHITFPSFTPLGLVDRQV